MLILTRKLGETIIIGDNIHIHILGFPRSTTVRLGIDAPVEIPIVRSELLYPKNKEEEDEK